MACSTKSIPLSWTTVFANSASDVFHPATPWMKADTAKNVRATFEVRSISGVCNVGVAYQVANAPDSPGNSATLGSAKLANGFYYPTEWDSVSTEADANQLIRYGWHCKNTAGVVVNPVRVAGKVEIRDF